MKSTRELTCIGCPLGCALQVDMEDGKIIAVRGYTCRNGKIYAEKECTNPTRILTSTVPVKNGAFRRVPVKTRTDIPKGELFHCMRLLKDVSLEAPVKEGEVVMRNAAGTGVDIIATDSVEIRKKS